MGGFMSIFSPPSPPPPPPPPPIVIPPAAPVTDAAEDENRKARLSAVARNRAGMAGTVATSQRGVLTPVSGTAQRKTLLGE
ncbi:MAG: hypothetical protein EPN26_02170 [Rhodospirillales bacterium]|nr:MAG: hypothetical protein EPN26_02170 [Rhodospirillales bacterium]